MDNMTSILMHYSGVMIGERVAIGALAVVIVGMFRYQENRKSSRWLTVTVILEILHLIGDAGTFDYSMHANLPLQIAICFYFMAYTFGPLTTIAFAKYVNCYIEERTNVNKWLFRVPILLEVITFCMITVAIISGSVYGIVDDKVTAIGNVPIITTIIQLIVIIYIPIAAMTKVMIIGGKAVFLLGLFGIVPGVIMFINYDYSVITAGFALLMVYILLQCDTSVEKEKQRAELTELNAQLEENQAQMEESASEQEAQIEEINALNSELTEQRDNLEKNYDAIQSLSKVYYASYYVDMDHDDYYELLSNDETRSKYAEFGPKGKAQAAINWACENNIAPEYREAARAFTNYSTLSERMRDTEIISIRVRLANGDWSRLRYIAGARHDDGRLKSCIFGARIVNDEVEEEQKRNAELQNALTLAQDSAAEQEAQLEEIAALNNQLQENQARLEEASAEQEAQLEETQALNQELQESRDRISESFGMIEGLSQEYHTIWLVNKETSKMRLIRSSGKTTIQRAVQMGIDEPLFDPAFDNYIGSCVEPEDRERMHREIAFAEVLRHLSEHPDELYAVNYLRRDDSGHVSYHQIAFANADTQDGKKQFVYGFRDVDKIVKEEQRQKEELQKAKEAAESANAAKTSFLFNMSHDIRTPMNAIMGFRDLLEKHQEDPVKRQDYLNKIQDASTVLLSIINNVLEMARIEKGTLEIDETAWSTEQFNDTLYSVFHVMMQEKGLMFTRQIEVQHHYVYCDPTKLREIFINILSNAYKYTNAGGSVNMHLEEIPSDREGWVLYQTTISDTGIGMSEEFLPHIFEEFARENNSTDAKVEGTGLGMPIVKRLVEMLDGTIEIKSKKGEGSTFIVTIPHKIADRSNLVDHAGVEVDPKLFKDKHILLAEDNELNAEIATEILTEAGFIVDRVEDGAICVDKLKTAKDNYYDLILMDIQMPNMNGYEATRAIRQLEDHDKANIKIIAMTANAFEEDKREALKAGMNGHLAKPINVNELMKTLATMIG